MSESKCVDLRAWGPLLKRTSYARQTERREMFNANNNNIARLLQVDRFICWSVRAQTRRGSSNQSGTIQGNLNRSYLASLVAGKSASQFMLKPCGAAQAEHVFLCVGAAKLIELIGLQRRGHHRIGTPTTAAAAASSTRATSSRAIAGPLAGLGRIAILGTRRPQFGHQPGPRFAASAHLALSQRPAHPRAGLAQSARP